MKARLLLVLCFSFFAHIVYGQQLSENSNKSFSLSLGAFHVPRGATQPYILSYFFQDTGPMITGGIDYNTTKASSHSFYARYGFLSSIKDTIVTPALDTNSIERYYDLKGIAQLFSLGYSWQHYFGKNLRLLPYTCLGGELLFQNRGTQTGSYDPSWMPGIIPYVNPGYSVFSLNLRLALGLRHKLTDRLTLFEHAEAGTLIFDSSGNGFQFSPIQIPRELLLNFSIGLSFKLK